MEAKGRGFLKVTGILMIIGGVLGCLVSLLAVASVGVLIAAGVAVEMGLLIAGTVVVVVGGVVQLVAGIQGVKNCDNVEAADKLIKLGIAILVINVVGTILNVVAGTAFNVVSFATSCILPVLFIIGANKNKQ